MTDPFPSLNDHQRDALRTLGHALDACGLPLAAVDEKRMTPDQRAFWTAYVVIPRTISWGDAA